MGICNVCCQGKSVRDHLIEMKIGDIHEFGGSKMQSTAGNSPAPKQTCHRLSRDCFRNFWEFTNSVVPSSVVIKNPSANA